MSKLCRVEKDYFERKMKEITDYIPGHYVHEVKTRANKMGLELTDDKIRNVRNKKNFDLTIFELLVEIAEERKSQFLNSIAEKKESNGRKFFY